ncbi:MAG: PepSY domain-containing protein [Capnocytophaga sp.]|nr:PepSY domain-containing protein [Capnocytophaga sp.]
MTLSLWRYAHLALALAVSVFVIIASVTGIILAVEPVSNQLKPLKSPYFEEVSLAETLSALQKNYPETVSLAIDDNHFVLAEVIDSDGDNAKFYIDPKTAEKVGETFKRPEIFQFSTTLHRSLFMGKAGRIIMAVVSCMLAIIVLTGIVLIIKKQQSWKRFFNKLVKEKFHQHYHTVFGRWMLLPILIITLSGIYLSLDKLSLLPDFKIVHNIDWDTLADEPKREFSDFEAFAVPLSEVRKVEFPFSDDVEDYYTVGLVSEEITVNQFTGEVLSRYEFPLSQQALHYSFLLHTGTGTIGWAVVLGLACVALLFFVFSGFAITLKRSKASIKNKFKKDECTHIILVGSEGGTTLGFANLLHGELLRQGKKSFLAEMSAFSSYREMTHLVVMTSTYGQGDPPSNAGKFISLWKKANLEKPFSFSVVGFGSLAYPDFCKFAFEVDAELSESKNAHRLSDIYTINNQSFESFCDWANAWGKTQELTFSFPQDFNPQKKRKQYIFKVIGKKISEVDGTFLISLESSKKQRFRSGDLLAIMGSDGRERLYSIGKTADRQILLSIKKHDKGLVSNLLFSLEEDSTLKGSFVKNADFHFPERAKKVVFIATGTGIAPFLGMMNTSENRTEKQLFWGGKTEQSFAIYRDFIRQKQAENQLGGLHFAFSRMGEKKYVQDLISEKAAFFAEIFRSGGVVMLCGSVAMQKGVTAVLDGICREYLGKPLSYFQNKKQLRMDCY